MSQAGRNGTDVSERCISGKEQAVPLLSPCATATSPEFASDGRLSDNLVPTFADSGVSRSHRGGFSDF
jgi:hypothetical protein